MLQPIMMHLTHLARLLPVLVFMVPLMGISQEPEAASGLADWQRQWEDAQTRESLADPERLSEQTEIVSAILESGQPVEEIVWGWTTDVLTRWEASSDLAVAREAYLSLLAAVCDPLTTRGESLPDELVLRGFLRKALGLTRSADEEGRFLFFLAESWLRSQVRTEQIQRRVESLLLQSVAALDNAPPLDAAQLRLGELYRSWGQENRFPDGEGYELSFLTQAVLQFEAVIRVPEARESLVAAARSALAELREPDLELNIEHRFLPQNEVRITLSARNVDAVQVQLTGLATVSLEGPVWATLSKLQDLAVQLDDTPEQLRFEETISLRGRNPNDWLTREVGLGDSFPAGWYGLTVSGAGVDQRGLVLVTPLEVTAISRGDGGLLVWVADAETGQSVAGAEVAVLSEDGEILFTTQTDFEGLLPLSGIDLADWSELHVRSGPNPGYLRRADLPQSQPVMPWIIANPSELEPGDLLQWCALGIDATNRPFLDPGPVLSLPDGSVIEATTARNGESWAAGVAQIPDSLEMAGPVYVTLPTGKQLYLAHVGVQSTRPLDLEFTGEALDESLNLFLASSTIGVQVSRVFGEESALPDYIRFRTTRLDRRAITGPDAMVAEGEVVYESILPLDTDDRGSLLVELPAIETGDRLVPIHVEVLPLSGSEPLAEGTIGLSPFRRTIRLSMPEHIVGAGQPVEVNYSTETIGQDSRNPLEGEFIVYRETWQSRYIHRRRGTTIPEEAYLALPDRSLLGSAKTDYRLMEQGFVREEVQRVPLESSDPNGSLAISIELPGYYRIEFDSREVDTHAIYPEGSLEVWYVPEDMDLRIFRSEKPRLIVESEPDGTQEILILLDRTRTSVLVDLERLDGSLLSRVSRPEEAALYIRLDEAGQSPLKVCRAIVVGNRRTDFLWKSEATDLKADWTLGTDSYFGLNPGVEFRWPMGFGETIPEGPVLWAFFPASSYPATPQRLRWQRQLHLETRHEEEAHTLTLSRFLPLLDPFPLQASERDLAMEDREVDWRDPDAFTTLFPELKRSIPVDENLTSPFQPVTFERDVPAAPPLIEGSFPNTAGRWQLALFSPTAEQDLLVRSWLISTELPIRSGLVGPGLLRVSDRADLWLSVENTTRRRVDLENQVQTGPDLALEQELGSPISLQPGERLELPLRMQAIRETGSTIDVRLESLSSTSEALHSLRVSADSPVNGLAFVLAEPQQSDLGKVLAFDKWTEGKLVIASSMGPVLPEIWPLLREAQRDREPLLSALGDWALWRVAVHHGTASVIDKTGVGSRLDRALREYHTEAGGWSWMPGLDADPWISALVLWTLEVFSGKDQAVFGDLRRDGRQYLESILIEENLDPERRLFALRALASPAFHMLDVRPSRIQARSFLDLLHQRTELSDAEIAMLLQVARAYGFSEEVSLLGDDLMQRFRNATQSDRMGLWTTSLMYLSLDDNEVTTDEGNALLLSALNNLAEAGPRRSWEQVAGFLNLLAAYYWKGDFYADGTVELSIDGADPLSIPLGPELPGSGFLELPLDPAQLQTGEVALRLNTSSALSPVLIAATGTTADSSAVSPLGSVELEWEREYYEETLMQGLRRRTTELDPSLEGIRAGDLLRVVILFDIDDDHSFADFRIPVPSGLSLDQERIEHLWEPGLEGTISAMQVLVDPVDPDDVLNAYIRMAPLPTGRHRLELVYEALWSGTFAWPEMQLLLPRTGEAYRLDRATQVTISPSAN